MIVIYGDSCVAGDGLVDPNSRVSNLLSQDLGKPVINMGVSGCGPMTIAQKINAGASTVIIAWPGLVRWTDPDGGLWGPWCFDRVSPWASEYRQLVESREIIDINLSAINSVRLALTGTHLIEYTYTFAKSYTKNMRYPMPSLGVRSFDFVDHAEDMMHPGPKTNAIIAQWLAASIKKPTEVGFEWVRPNLSN
jgi:hypothetical protein